MPEIEITQRFLAAFEQLPQDVQKKVKKALRLLAENPQHPSLRTKPIQGIRGIYEASADMHYRITYERLPGDILRIRTVGIHDDALRKP
jgi:mRNA interferase RelE/StbE